MPPNLAYLNLDISDVRTPFESALDLRDRLEVENYLLSMTLAHLLWKPLVFCTQDEDFGVRSWSEDLWASHVLPPALA